MSTDDATLAQGLRSGSAEARDALERAWREPLVRFCRSYLRRVEDAEDAAAEVLLRVLSARDVPDALKPWILRIARNHCLNALRDAAPRAHEELASDADPTADATGPATSAARVDERLRLERMLARLAPAERELLRLRYADGLAREDIAAVLDLPASVVKSRLYEAIAKLRAGASGSDTE